MSALGTILPAGNMDQFTGLQVAVSNVVYPTTPVILLQLTPEGYYDVPTSYAFGALATTDNPSRKDFRLRCVNNANPASTGVKNIKLTSMTIQRLSQLTGTPVASMVNDYTLMLDDGIEAVRTDFVTTPTPTTWNNLPTIYPDVGHTANVYNSFPVGVSPATVTTTITFPQQPVLNSLTLDDFKFSLIYKPTTKLATVAQNNRQFTITFYGIVDGTSTIVKLTPSPFVFTASVK